MSSYEFKMQHKNIKNIMGVTHAHKKVSQMGFLINYFIQEGMQGKDPRGTTDIILFENNFLNKSARTKLKKVMHAADGSEDSTSVIEKMNSGFIEDVTFSAIYAALKGQSFEDAVLIAANGCGDSDSRAALTGALLGMYNGASGIPAHLKLGIKDNKRLEGKAKRITKFKKKPTSSF